MKVEQFNRTLQQYSLTLRQASQVRARLRDSKEKLFEAVSQMDPLMKGSFTRAELLSLWSSALVGNAIAQLFFEKHLPYPQISYTKYSVPHPA